MGSWGTGPFDNDDALGFFGELEDAAAEAVLRRIREVLSATADRPGYLEVDEGNVAVAAAALVAAGCSEGATLGHPSIDSWLSHHRPVPAPEDQKLATEALERLTAPGSEWLELWQQAGAEQRVRTELRRLHAMLHGDQA
jgi:hypothetical protein